MRFFVGGCIIRPTPTEKAMPNNTTTKPTPRTVRECHDCPRNGKGDDYCWKVCQDPSENSNQGRKLVRTGGMDAAGEFIHDNLSENDKKEADERDTEFTFIDEEMRSRSSSVTATLTEETERNMAVVISSLFALPDIQLCILKHLLFGEDYATIGRNLPKPMSKEAVLKHLVDMRGKCGFVANIMREMQIKGQGGAKRRQAYNLEFAY